jgi:hypothetical protein
MKDQFLFVRTGNQEELGVVLKDDRTRPTTRTATRWNEDTTTPPHLLDTRNKQVPLQDDYDLEDLRPRDQTCEILLFFVLYIFTCSLFQILINLGIKLQRPGRFLPFSP